MGARRTAGRRRLATGLAAGLAAAVGATAGAAPAEATVTPGAPVVALSFDEGQGSVARDSSPYGNDGAITGAQWSEVGRHGGALRFEADDRVTIADAPALDQTTLTLEAWVRPDHVGGYETVMARKAPDPATTPVYALYASTPGWMSSPPGASSELGGVSGTDGLSTGAWSHLAATFDGFEWRLYVNGALVRTMPGRAAPAHSDRPLIVGAFEQLPTQGYDGLIDEVRVYPRALSAAEIARDRDTRVGTPPQPEGPAAPVLAMGFEDGAGELATDSSTYGNHGTLYGGRWTSDGRFGKGVVIGADEGHVQIADSGSLDFTTAFTISAWVKPRTANQYQSILSKDIGLDYVTWQLFAYNGPDGSPPFGMIAKGLQSTAGQWWVVPPQSAALPVGQWTHLALTLGGGTARLYRNGVQVTSATNVGPAVASTGPLHIGGARASANDESFEGVIDEVRAYDVALTQGDVVVDRDTPVRRMLAPPADGGGAAPATAPEHVFAPLHPAPAITSPPSSAPGPAAVRAPTARKTVKVGTRSASKRKATVRCATRKTKKARRVCVRARTRKAAARPRA